MTLIEIPDFFLELSGDFYFYFSNTVSPGYFIYHISYHKKSRREKHQEKHLKTSQDVNKHPIKRYFLHTMVKGAVGMKLEDVTLKCCMTAPWCLQGLPVLPIINNLSKFQLFCFLLTELHVMHNLEQRYQIGPFFIDKLVCNSVCL